MVSMSSSYYLAGNLRLLGLIVMKNRILNFILKTFALLHYFNRTSFKDVPETYFLFIFATIMMHTRIVYRQKT